MRDTGTRFNLTPCQFEQWVRFDLWELRQAAFILSGFEPPGLDDLRLTPVFDYVPTGRRKTWREVLDGKLDRKVEPLFKVAGQWDALVKLRTLIRALQLAVKSNALLATQNLEGGHCVTHIKPAEVINWCRGKGYSIPLELKDSTPKPRNPLAPYVAVRIEIPIPKCADGLVETIPPYTPETVLYDTPTELAGLLEESTPSTEHTAGKKEAVKAGIAWRREHPGESRRDLKTELADLLKIEIKDGWIDEIMRLTLDIPTNKGGRRKHP